MSSLGLLSLQPLLGAYRTVELVSGDTCMATSVGAAQLTTPTLTAVPAALNTHPRHSGHIRAGEAHRVHTQRGTPSRTADLAALTSIIGCTANVTGRDYIIEVGAGDCTGGGRHRGGRVRRGKEGQIDR